MKRFLYFLMMFFPLWAIAGLDEVSIFTEDETCGIHYLSSRPKKGWHIKVDPNACQNGWVEGLTEVELYSPTKEKMETLGGFFKEGYWLDTFRGEGRVIDRTSPSDKIQSLFFLLGEDREANITYVGQLRSIQPEGRPYGPFQGCPDFRMLVVVPDISVFKNEAFLDKIVQQGLSYARSYCQKPEVLALFGATSIQNPQIAFQMQVDVKTGNRQEISIKEQQNAFETTPLELREEMSDVLVSVKPDMDQAIVSYNPVKAENLILSAVPAPQRKDILGHLQILSRTSKEPVWGRTVVHIKEVLLDGTGLTDLPTTIQLLYYPGLKTGWAVIEGTLSDDKMRVSNVHFCDKEWCSDVP